MAFMASSVIFGIMTRAAGGGVSNLRNFAKRNRARLIHCGWFVAALISWRAFSDRPGIFFFFF